MLMEVGRSPLYSQSSYIEDKYLVIFNPIYQQVFTLDWLEQQILTITEILHQPL